MIAIRLITTIFAVLLFVEILIFSSNASAIDYTVPPDINTGVNLIGTDTLTINNGGSVTVGAGPVVDSNGSDITINNSGSISGGSTFGIQNSGTLTTFNNTNTGSVTGVTRAINNSGTINSISNYGSLTSPQTGITNTISGSIVSLTNGGAISGNTFFGINNRGTIDILNNTVSGSISGVVRAIDNRNSIQTIINNGTLSSDQTGIRNRSGGTIVSINNNGSISGNTFYGINNEGLINELSNIGSIIGTSYSIDNTGTILNLANAQSTFTYRGNLPNNYNIIINSNSDYGKLMVTNAAGTTNFGITSTSATGTFSEVISGVTQANLAALTGTFGAFNWTLSDSNADNSWDLYLSGNVLSATQKENNTPAFNAASVIDTSADLLNLFSAFTTQQEISDAVTQTLPLMSGDITKVVLNAQSGVNKVIQARSAANLRMSLGDDIVEDRYFWAKPFGSWANQDSRNSVSGYESDSYGVIFGTDGVASDTLRLGGAIAYISTDVDTNSTIAPQSADIETWQFLAYGSLSLDNKTEVNFQADVGLNQTDGLRNMPSFNSTARADYDSLYTHVGLGVSHSYELNSNTGITASARVDYSNLDSDGYTEIGAGALNLTVNNNTAKELIWSVNGNLTHNIDESTALKANIGVGYDSINEQASIIASYVGGGASFATNGIDSDPWIGRVGIGVRKQTSETMQLSFNYDAELREDFDNQTVSAKFRWNF